MPDSSIEVRLRLVRKSEMACLVTNRKSEAEPRTSAHFEKWIPRSLMGTTSTSPDANGGFSFITFRLPEWKIDQENLWDYTTS